MANATPEHALVERYALAFALSPVPLLLVDASGHIRLVSDEMAALFEYAPDALLGAAVERLLPPDAQAHHPQLRQAYLENASKRPMGRGRELEGLSRTNRRIPLELGLTPVPHEGEVWTVVTAVDTSERRAKQRAIAARDAAAAHADQLAQLNDDLTQFAYAASHDLKAPLATIHGMLGLALEDLDEGHLENVKRDLAKLRSLAEHSAEKVEHVLQLARVGHDHLPRGGVALDALAMELWEEVTLGAASPPRFELDDGLPAPLRTVPQAIEVILRKLLSNAARYVDSAKGDPWVRLRARQERGWTVLELADNGVGMSHEQVKTAFQMFGRNSARSGHGLGLAVARRQVEGLGGTIRCESREGEGTTFEVRLPELP
ncbi:MAG: PAS domain-containing sensor histidine kinase [Myxococcota bacterium]